MCNFDDKTTDEFEASFQYYFENKEIKEQKEVF